MRSSSPSLAPLRRRHQGQGHRAGAYVHGNVDLLGNLIAHGPETRGAVPPHKWEVDAATGFTDACTHLRTGAPGQDRIGLLNVLLAEGLNLGLSKMAEASNTHDFFQLARLSCWHIESEAINRALAMVIEAPAQLPMARLWGRGLTASSDGQFFPAARQGEAMNLVRVNRMGARMGAGDRPRHPDGVSLAKGAGVGQNA